MSRENTPNSEHSEHSEHSDDRDVVIANHRYDGIREYDNPMPGWWSAIFWACVVFSIIYVVGIYTGFVDDYDDDLNDSLEELATIRATYDQENPSTAVDADALDAAVADPLRISEGATLYAAQCAACHGPEGQGLIGPNMTDQYFIHGATNLSMYEVIGKGVVEKGMPPWESVYTPEQRASLVAFVRSIEGTNPSGAKDPQGDLVQ